ncbi:hypothetical protein CkaCkLH20_04727 [Colletotrichum karsti]|uniref:AT hook domain-containing protein n=1 Tax=Colletotrichum karsti TaxID=1095194 RepID=A0A9P6LMK6_9PEZI|nr:uncharacterized protein CkaCkLH20_04727 [Colletotrichum karsti]KAF9877592.1 hypothetical protein CkaCkLH20_04727 [Colletotrichum karsti]
MAPARIIADSDDSDDDFDVGDSPAKPPTPRKSGEGRCSDPISVSTGSTDPFIFRQIYDDQRKPAANEAVSQADPTSAPNVDISSSVSIGVKVPTKNDDTNTSSLTSITDPTMGSNRAKKAKMAEVVDLTQVTTPGRAANNTPKDMWDVPSSPAEQPTAPVASLLKNKEKTPASSKRKQANVDFTTPLATVMPSQGSTQPFDITPIGRANFPLAQPAKRQRLDAPVSSVATEDDVDMIVPHHDESVFVDAPVSGQKPVSLYIEPRTLSASQQLQYEYHSVDPSPDDARPATSRHFTTQQAAARSSGATTIAYSTPSQTRVLGFQESFAGDTEAGTVYQPPEEVHEPTVNSDATIEIPSSPDIISAAPARTKRSKQNEESGHTSHSHNADEWNSDDVGFPREMYKPRPSRRRGSNASRQSDTEKAASADTAAPVPEPITSLPAEEVAPASVSKKKRGRPRKSDTTPTSEPVEPSAPATAVGSEAAGSTVVAEPVMAATEQIKKKRGRPKKADKAVTSVQQEPVEQHAVAEATEANDIPAVVDSKTASDHQSEENEEPPKAKKIDKKKRPVQEVSEKAPAGEVPTGETRALQPKTPNTASKPDSDDLDPQKDVVALITPKKLEDKKDVAGKAGDGKLGVATPSSQAGKPLYRVGLSKKSKIAPLLKIVRK